MLSKIFKKDEPAAPTPPVREPAPAPDKSLWESKLRDAGNNEETLLSVAKDAPLEEIKLAAIQSLVSEEGLKAAEREFRNHDRRVHREAKQRYEAAVATRENREQATQLIATASALQAEAHLPANRLVELDHAWQALNHALLDPAQVAQFSDAWTALSGQARERGERLQHGKRWAAEANGVASHLVAVIGEVANGSKDQTALATARGDAETKLAAAPNADDTKGAQITAATARLTEALALAGAMGPRLAILDEIAQAGAEVPADIAARWQALPPIAERGVMSALSQRFSNWQQGKSAADQAQAAAEKQQQTEQNKAERQARLEKISTLIASAETALAEGHIAQATARLGALDEVVGTQSLDKKLHQRIETVQAEVARLKGWQHWGGGRVRDDLVLESEALAKAASAEKLAVKSHGDAIDNLRDRWKELDKLGGATSRALWLRFDGALKTAYLPVAAHLAKLKEARSQNLAARQALIATLDTVDIGDAEKQPDFRALARHLEQFQSEWRKLGPVEHTVPRKAQPGLDQKLKAAVARVESPLQEARRVEQLKREKLIERAKALAADTKARDTIIKVRELQAEWQQHAKGLPLARKVENVLWGQFKVATDAVFAQRDAANAARDAGFGAARGAREALIARLNALTADTPAGEIRKTMADVDSEWRRAGEASRNDAPKLEQRFRHARDAAQQHLAGSALRLWHQTCDLVSTKMGLCAEAEGGSTDASIGERWAALPALPADWEKALAARLAAAQSGQTANAEAESLQQVILQVESALEIPSPPEFEAARRELKLRAMKNAIEGRQSATVTAKDIEGWIATAIGQSGASAKSAGRITAILTALRSKPLTTARPSR
ncbi:MAG: DUF349 domain-containing protein [Betaproteobacteria bacterium]|nr:DUF349 domain-containing protein [Betaproteobacteria bacterium]